MKASRKSTKAARRRAKKKVPVSRDESSSEADSTGSSETDTTNSSESDSADPSDTDSIDMREILKDLERVENENESLQQNLKQRGERLTVLERHYVSHKRKILDLEGQLKRAQSDVLESKQKQETLRQVVLQAGDQQFHDAEFVSLFADIRREIQSIAHSKIYRLDQASYGELKALSPNTREFVSTLMHTPRNSRKLRLRAKIHEILHESVLNKEYFGISGSEQWRQESGWTAETPHRIEESLMQFERFLVNHEVSDNAISAWRIATLKCINFSRLKGNFVDVLANRMVEFFQPLIPTTVDSQMRAKLQRDFARLCGDACKLRLLMRESKEGYSCQILPNGSSFHQHEHLADDFGTEGDGIEVDHIAFTVSGALIKNAKYRGEELKVLEKAHVVLGTK